MQIPPEETVFIRTLIVDDAPEAINNLKDLLSDFKEIHEVYEASSAKKAIQLIIDKKPDLLFLDVEMPEKNGFDLINDLIKNNIKCPKVIFTTAYEHYAIEALRNQAIDFLLKPIDILELTLAIQRFKTIRNTDQEQQKLESLSRTLKKDKRIVLPTITGLKQIFLSEVLYFQKENDTTEKVTVHYSQSHKEIIPGFFTLKQILEMLPPDDFFQIDRRTIINLDYLSNIETKPRICILNKCKDQIQLPISRGRLKAFRGKCQL